VGTAIDGKTWRAFLLMRLCKPFRFSKSVLFPAIRTAHIHKGSCGEVPYRVSKESLMYGRSQYGGIIGLIWLLGLAVMYAFDLWWPGILILVGISAVVGTILRPMISAQRQQQPPYQPSQPPRQPEPPLYPPPPYQGGYPPYYQPSDPYLQQSESSAQEYDQPRAHYPQELPPQQ
jgi:hypothetical protein